MTLAPYELKATLIPAELTDGLSNLERKALEETVFKINLGFGNVLKDTARLLYRLKQDIPHGHFTRFLQSKLIPVTPRTARDLIAAHDWLEGTCVNDQAVSQLGARVLRSIASAPPAIQQRIEEDLESGRKVTEQYVSQLVATNNRTEEVEEDIEEVKGYKIKYVRNLEEERDYLQLEVNELKKKVADLQAMLSDSAVEV